MPVLIVGNLLTGRIREDPPGSGSRKVSHRISPATAVGGLGRLIMSHVRRDPPGPKRGFLGLSHLKRMQADLLGFPTELARTYGDLVCVPMGPMRLYFVNHPN